MRTLGKYSTFFEKTESGLCPLERCLTWAPATRLSSTGERPTANTLSAYLRSGQIGQALEATGHRWIWHREVIGDLFVERVLARTFAHDEQLDPSVLERVFRRLCTELKTPTLKLRHVLVVHEFPVLPKELHTSGGVRLIPFDMATGYGALWTLLGSEYQRDVRKWGGGNGLFAVVDEIIHKSGEPDDIRAAAERMNEKAAYALGALRLAYEGVVRVSRSYFVQHVSEFPLLPPNREDIQGSEDINLVSQLSPTATEMRLFREALSLVSRSAHPKSWPRFITAFQRFNRAFRGRDEFENFVDLVVALEGLFGVREEELRFRLAVRAALLLGDSGAGSRIVYRQVTAAYHIRNTLVHGQGSSNDIERSSCHLTRVILPN
jgi:hypothetical protein